MKHTCVSSESFHDWLRPTLSPVTARYCKYCSSLRFLDKWCLCDLSGVLALILKIAFAELYCKATCKNRTLRHRKNDAECHYLNSATDTVSQPAYVSIPRVSTKYPCWFWTDYIPQSETVYWLVIYAVLNDGEIE